MDWGRLIRSTLSLYARCARETWERALGAWWLALLPFVYGPIVSIVAFFTAPLGPLAGVLVWLAMAACLGSYLYFLGEAVGGRRISAADLGESFRAYLGPVISVMFIVMLVRWTLALALPPGTGSVALRTLLNLGLFVLLNPVPEILYQTRAQGLAVLGESVEFLRDNWPEWFFPLAGLGVIFVFVLPFPILLAPLMVGRLVAVLPWSVAVLSSGSFFALLFATVSLFGLFLLMVFRGVLFRELHGSSRRQRLFRAQFD